MSTPTVTRTTRATVDVPVPPQRLVQLVTDRDPRIPFTVLALARQATGAGTRDPKVRRVRRLVMEMSAAGVFVVEARGTFKRPHVYLGILPVEAWLARTRDAGSRGGAGAAASPTPPPTPAHEPRIGDTDDRGRVRTATGWRWPADHGLQPVEFVPGAANPVPIEERGQRVATRLPGVHHAQPRSAWHGTAAHVDPRLPRSLGGMRPG
jgi:hypothetical protein